jgi:flagellar hook protein FlgE
MLRSLNAGVSGLKGFQTKLDVIGNNIANVNTVGYKKSRVVFEDLLSQNMRGATAPSAASSGGINPLQVGLGTKVASVDTIQTAGSPTTTNVATDLYISGNGFFVVQDGSGQKFLTRAGDFTLDAQGHLVNPDGMMVVDANTKNPIVINQQTYPSFSIDANGNIIGKDTTGASTTIATIGTAVVANPSGLQKAGGSLYSLTPNADSAASIDTLIADRATNNAGQIVSGQLEMSNVDLSEEMTDMITAQRGFQANAKIITVSDSILEELVNLKR